MKIDFACPTCGRGYSADAAHAGRRARCKQCGGTVTVPAETDVFPLAAEPSEPTTASRGMGDALPVPERMGANVFVSTRGEKETVPKPRKRRKNVDRQFQRAGEEIRGFAARHAKPVLWMLGIAAVVGVALLLVAILLPDGTMIAGIALAGIGFVFMLVGYGVGAYAAFSEDFLWGFLFLVFPIYTAYYLVSNWDEMWRWFLVWSAGAAVLLLAIVVMSAGVEQAEKAKRKAHSSWNGETRQFFAVRSSAAAWGI